MLRVNLTLTDGLAHPGICLSWCRMLAQQRVKDNRPGLGFPEVLVRVSEAVCFQQCEPLWRPPEKRPVSSLRCEHPCLREMETQVLRAERPVASRQGEPDSGRLGREETWMVPAGS